MFDGGWSPAKEQGYKMCISKTAMRVKEKNMGHCASKIGGEARSERGLPSTAFWLVYPTNGTFSWLGIPVGRLCIA